MAGSKSIYTHEKVSEAILGKTSHSSFISGKYNRLPNETYKEVLSLCVFICDANTMDE